MDRQQVLEMLVELCEDEIIVETQILIYLKKVY